MGQKRRRIRILQQNRDFHLVLAYCPLMCDKALFSRTLVGPLRTLSHNYGHLLVPSPLPLTSVACLACSSHGDGLWCVQDIFKASIFQPCTTPLTIQDRYVNACVCFRMAIFWLRRCSFPFLRLLHHCRLERCQVLDTQICILPIVPWP